MQDVPANRPVSQSLRDPAMPARNPWTTRIAASLGCFALFVLSFASALLLIPRSWRDLDDANVRMQVHIFRFHVYDEDFIWAAVAFGSVVLTVAAMFLCCLWVLWKVIAMWNPPPGKDGRRD